MTAEPSWSKNIDDVFTDLHASPGGLTQEETDIRLKKFGPNTLARTKRLTALSRLLQKLFNPLILLLLAAGFISAVLGQTSDFLIIVAITVISIAIDVYQEHQADHSAEKLRRRVSLSANVLRDGVFKEVPLAFLVPGDVIQVTMGDIIPADCRLMHQKDLTISESTLTGESYPVKKQADAPVSDAALIFERTNVLFMGTTVVTGEGTAVVVATGSKTEFGKVATSLVAPRPETEFEKGVRAYGNFLMKTALVMGAVLFVLHTVTHQHNIFSSLLFVLALAISFAPELLPMILTINLSKGAIRMSRKGVIVKHIPAIENFGSMDVLCTDKTGTLTDNAIELAAYADGDGDLSEKVLDFAFLNSHFQTGFRGPMEDAIMSRPPRPLDGWEFIDCIPFDFFRKRVSVICKKGADTILITKGSPEELFSLSVQYERSGKIFPVSADDLRRFTKQFETFSRDGYRLLAVAYKKYEFPDDSMSVNKGIDDRESNLIFLGFLAFLDPAKKTAKDALTRLEHHGISIKILTGDNELVTEKICRDLSLPVAGIVSGSQLQAMSDDELEHVVEQTTIFSRLNPDLKERVIRAIRANGHVVGFVGDGINDASSLRAADIGISVNNAVDVAKESADIILLHKDLHVLLDGVHEGRKTFGNIMKYLMMGTSSNFGNMISLAVGSVFLPFLPMLPVQVLLNDLLYDISQLFLASDHVDAAYIIRPRKWDITFLRHFTVIFGPVNSLFDLLTFYLLLQFFHASIPLFQTGWFMENIVAQTLIVFSIRTVVVPFFKSHPSKLFSLSVAAITVFGLILPVTPVAAWFSFVPVPFSFYVFLSALMLLYFLLVEFVKRWFYSRYSV